MRTPRRTAWPLPRDGRGRPCRWNHSRTRRRPVPERGREPAFRMRRQRADSRRARGVRLGTEGVSFDEVFVRSACAQPHATGLPGSGMSTRSMSSNGYSTSVFASIAVTRPRWWVWWFTRWASRTDHVSGGEGTGRRPSYGSTPVTIPKGIISKVTPPPFSAVRSARPSISDLLPDTPRIASGSARTFSRTGTAPPRGWPGAG